MAALVGLDPMPMTFAELRRAYHTKVDFEWGRLAVQMAHNANMNQALMSCHPGVRVRRHGFKPDDFYTPRWRRNKRKRSADIGSLKAMFTRPA
jgi:hypothetical protein